MRYIPWILLLGSAVIFFGCDDGAAVSPCPGGQEMCEGSCKPISACSGYQSSTGGSTAKTTTSTRAPVDPGPYSSPDCTDTATAAKTLTGRYDMTEMKATDDKEYAVATNWWGEFDGQTVAYQGLSFTIGNPNDVIADENNPIGFPTMFIGNYQGRSTAKSNLPKLVSELSSVPTVFSTNAADGARDEYNAAYDVWFTQSQDPLPSSAVDPGKGGAFLMVWLFKPTRRQPRGAMKYGNHKVDGVENGWNVWIDPSDPPCISYVATTPVNGLAFDLNRFIQDSVKNNYGVTANMSLSIVFAGFEIWGHGDGLQMKNFCAQVN